MWRRFAHLSLSISRTKLQSLQDPTVLKLINTFSSDAGNDGVASSRKPFITFVLGGPGSGKGTQCEKIASIFGFAHLSAGELLREEMSSPSENGELIRNVIKEGKIVPSAITISLIKRGINSATSDKILIDGFPRSEENRIAFEKIIGVEPDLVIFFECPEEEMVKRILGRNQGRIDDNMETIRKRLKVFEDLNMPVVEHYSSKGKVHKITATGTVDEIFERVRQVFASLRYLKAFLSF
ncbi:UMP-CMP kinase [Rhynchospora pubera]|uniref:UMP-CMP kinase n=1 Tax=Rhynchospora pubera TaxID=906938 RepID=A0AAV8BVR5_9POAL|nr:UMP-CMP kinase [Rhynchospora pubera]